MRPYSAAMPAISRCHAFTASASLSSPFNPKFTILPSAVAYHVCLLSRNHGLFALAIGVDLADAYFEYCPLQKQGLKTLWIKASRRRGFVVTEQGVVVAPKAEPPETFHGRP